MKLLATTLILSVITCQNLVAADFAESVMDATFKLFNPASTSTCFLSQGSEKDAPLFLITTAHTLERMKGETAILVLRRSMEDGAFQRVDHEIEIRKGGKPLWRRHMNQDVAVLRIDDQLPVSVTPIAVDRLADAGMLTAEGVGICDRLFVFTYPERFESSNAGHPVARQGIFSSPPRLPADRYPTFLADFTTFSGDSGGPVFIQGTDEKPVIVGVVVGQQHHDERIESAYENRLVKHPFRLGIVLHARYVRETLKLAATASELTTDTAPSLSIELSPDGWPGAQESGVLKVLNSAALPIWSSAGKPSLRPIAVVHDPKGPLVAFDRGENDTYKVLLNVKGRLWARFAFQFSHEMCHILANYRDVPNQQMWFEEAICEAASLYSLRKMGGSWKVTPPYPNWKSYADSLTKYADDRIAGATPIESDDLVEWYERHRTMLGKTATNRELNLVAAIKLLEIFERYPNGWKSVRSLNRGDPTENRSLDAYLAGWYTRAAKGEKPIVKEIASLFMISVPDQQ